MDHNRFGDVTMERIWIQMTLAVTCFPLVLCNIYTEQSNTGQGTQLQLTRTNKHRNKQSRRSTNTEVALNHKDKHKYTRATSRLYRFGPTGNGMIIGAGNEPKCAAVAAESKNTSPHPTKCCHSEKFL